MRQKLYCQTGFDHLIQGEALKRLDDLPAFGTSSIGDFDAWRKFVRRRVLTQKIITEFDVLFPHSQRKLDGVVEATLWSAWLAVHDSGNVILLDA